MSEGNGKVRICSVCGIEPARPGQGTGKFCHAERMRRERAEAKAAEQARARAVWVMEMGARGFATGGEWVVTWDWEGKPYQS